MCVLYKQVSTTSACRRICSNATLAPSISIQTLPPPPHVAMPPPREASLKPQRPALPKIDSSVAGMLRSDVYQKTANSTVSVPFAGELTPASSGNGSVSSPRSATSGRGSSWRAPTRRPTVMIQQGPPSPELINLDCAFPPFPTINSKASKKDEKKNRGEKHTKSRPASPAGSASSSRQVHRPSPLSRNTSTASARQRAKSLSEHNKLGQPPPSNSSSRKPSTENVPPIPTGRPDSSLQLPTARNFGRADTSPIMPSSQISHQTPGSLQRYATMDSVLPRRPEADAPQVSGPDTIQFSNPFPMAQPSGNPEPTYEAKRPPPIASNISAFPPGKDMSVGSRTIPPPPSASSLSRSLTKLFGRRRSQSTSTAKREMVRDALGDELESDASMPPSSIFGTPRSLPSAPHSAPTATDETKSVALEPPSAEYPTESSQHLTENDAIPPPLIIEPANEVAETSDAMHFDFGLHQPVSHIPSQDLSASTSIARRPSETDVNRSSIDSASSYGSIGFDERTASSRSSAPMTEDLAMRIRGSQQSEAIQLTTIEMPPPLRPKNLDYSADSPTDPLFINGRLSPIPQEKATNIQARPIVLEMPPPPRPTRPQRKQSLAVSNNSSGPHKGICRACSSSILPKERSVTSADGRLSGRYHKDCFVCTTCKAAFSSAEIYVHADRPYCAHHYHEQENSLCATCGNGIEGLYMETANVAGRGREKHHPGCLKCTTCRVQLTNDYFELSGKVYCEKDAFRLASVPKLHDRSPARPSPLVREYISSGDPKLLQKGTNFPERRITRIMTTT